MLLIVKPSENTGFGAEIFANVQVPSSSIRSKRRVARGVRTGHGFELGAVGEEIVPPLERRARLHPMGSVASVVAVLL